MRKNLGYKGGSYILFALNFENLQLPSKSHLAVNFESPGEFTVIIRWFPVNSAGPVVKAFVEDYIRPGIWYSVGRVKINSNSPQIFHAKGNVKTHIYFDPAIDFDWTFDQIQIILSN